MGVFKPETEQKLKVKINIVFVYIEFTMKRNKFLKNRMCYR